MKRVFLFLLSAICFQFAYAQGYTPDNLPDVKLRDANAYVNNIDGILSADTENKLNLLLRNLQDSTTVDVAVVVVNAIDPQYDIDEFATLLFTKWGIGAKNDNGLLFLMAINDRKMVFRTGYGLEGSLPDVVLGRIIRNDMAPLMKQGLTDDAVSAGVGKVAAILYDPTLRDELYSEDSEDNASAPQGSFFERNPVYVALSFIIGGLCILFFIWVLVNNKTSYAKFQLFNKAIPAFVILLFIFPITMIVLNMVFFVIRRILRKRAPHCPKCQQKMTQVFDPNRIRYLTPIQDCETRIKSVNYDVWKCSCGQVKNLAYGRISSYIKCPHCSAKAYYIQATKVIIWPTYSTTGSGIRTYNCKYCNRTDKRTYTIPRTQRASSDSDSFSSDSSGDSGGSRGGGSTGGGGASGGW